MTASGTEARLITRQLEGSLSHCLISQKGSLCGISGGGSSLQVVSLEVSGTVAEGKMAQSEGILEDQVSKGPAPRPFPSWIQSVVLCMVPSGSAIRTDKYSVRNQMAFVKCERDRI